MVVPFPMTASDHVTQMTALSKSNNKAFLSQIFSGLEHGGFRFPKATDTDGDGHLATNPISRLKVLSLRKKDADGMWKWVDKPEVALLCAHLNFSVNPGQIARGELRLNLSRFHLTVRRFKDQNLIGAHGPSILTAKTSIHIGPGGVWGRPDNLEALALDLKSRDQINVSADDIVASLTEDHPYSGADMRQLAGNFLNAIRRHVSGQLPGVTVELVRQDSTWS